MKLHQLLYKALCSLRKHQFNPFYKLDEKYYYIGVLPSRHHKIYLTGRVKLFLAGSYALKYQNLSIWDSIKPDSNKLTKEMITLNYLRLGNIKQAYATYYSESLPKEITDKFIMEFTYKEAPQQWWYAMNRLENYLKIKNI